MFRRLHTAKRGQNSPVDCFAATLRSMSPERYVPQTGTHSPRAGFILPKEGKGTQVPLPSFEISPSLLSRPTHFHRKCYPVMRLVRRYAQIVFRFGRMPRTDADASRYFENASRVWVQAYLRVQLFAAGRWGALWVGSHQRRAARSCASPDTAGTPFPKASFFHSGSLRHLCGVFSQNGKSIFS